MDTSRNSVLSEKNKKWNLSNDVVSFTWIKMYKDASKYSNFLEIHIYLIYIKQNGMSASTGGRKMAMGMGMKRKNTLNKDESFC